MASDTISNEVHKSIANGTYVEVNSDTATNFTDIFHKLNASVGKLLNTNKIMFIYLIVRIPNGSGGTVGNPFCGFVIKVSETILLGIMTGIAITDNRVIRFRDNTSDSAATYTIYTLQTT